MDAPVDNSHKGKSYFGTLNNYTEEEVEHFKAFVEAQCTSGVVGKEIGESGTPHLQFTFVLRRAQRFSFLKENLSGRAHFEVTRSDLAASRYCAKEGSVVVDLKARSAAAAGSGAAGTLAQEKREAIRRAAGAHLSPGELLALAPNMTELKLIHMADVQKAPSCRPRKVIWQYGPTGSGKTKYAYDVYMQMYPDSNCKWRMQPKWFSSVPTNVDMILIEEARPNIIPYTFLLELLDDRPSDIENKGGHIWWNPQLLVINSAFPPDAFAVEGEDNRQLLRRIHEIWYFSVSEGVFSRVPEVGPA